MEGDSEMEVSIANLTLTYLSIYDAAGERVTSFVTSVHGDTVEELQAKAEAEYPDKIHVVQDALTYNEALQGDLLYKDGEYQARPEPTEDEKRDAALASLDVGYSTKINDIETEMAKAKAVEDEDYYSDLKAEREELVAEYTRKRGAI